MTQERIRDWLEFGGRHGAYRPREGLLDRMATVLWLRYGPEGRRTLREIGGHLGLSAERIRQIEVQSLRMLRWPPRRHMVEASGLMPADSALGRAVYGG